MKIQDEFIEKFGFDALAHMGYGGWITALGLPFSFLGVIIMGIITIIIETLKEKFLDTNFSKTDFIWTIVGVLLTVSYAIIIYFIIL